MKYKAIVIPLLFIMMFVFNSSFLYAVPAGSGVISVPPASGVTSPNNSTPITPLENPLKAKNIQSLLFSVVDLMIFIGVIVAVMMFLWVGFKFVMARGSDTKLKEAKMWFLYAVIGTAILISSKVIVDVIKNTLTSAGVVDSKLWDSSK